MGETGAFTGEFVVLGASPPRLELDHLARYEYAKSFVRGKTVLDAACGSGYGTKMLTAAGARHVVGIDISDEALGFSRSGGNAGDASYVNGDVAALPFRPGFDVVCSFETVEHVPDANRMVEALREALVPGGTFLVSSPNRPITSPGAPTLNDRPKNPFHVQEFTPSELCDLLTRHGFTVRRVLGQRLVWKLPTRAGRYVSLRVAERLRLGSPKLTPIRYRSPRYFLVVAERS